MDESIESKPFAEEASLPELTPDIRDDDYSDVASHDSQDEQTERRRYQRGGRKKTSQKSSRMPPVGEPPVKPENNKQTQTDEDPEYEQPQPRRERPRPRRESPNPRNQPTKPPTDFATGIRSFNVRRATGSGGRPVSVRSVPGKSKTKKKAKPKKEEENSDPEEQYIESQTEQDEEDEEPPQKPMSIRLDLNIVLEVFLKAKIQGDVTITFLE